MGGGRARIGGLKEEGGRRSGGGALQWSEGPGMYTSHPTINKTDTQTEGFLCINGMDAVNKRRGVSSSHLPEEATCSGSWAMLRVSFKKCFSPPAPKTLDAQVLGFPVWSG